MAALASALLSGAVHADDALNVLVMRAADLEAQGRCADAVEVVQDSDRESAHLALIAGRCQVRLRDYAGAAKTLRAAQDQPEASAEVDLQLGIARYHLGELEPARVALDRARARGSEGALLELYTGLLQLHADDTRAAALSLERARREDPRAVEPVASYYSFIAWRNLEDEERAQAALERLRQEDPNGPWIAEAERMLASGRPATPTWWAEAEAGLEFDSNVTVQGGGVSNVFINGDIVSDDEDGRGIWTLDGGSELFRTDTWSGGVLGSYTGTAHFDISEFDAHNPTAALWLDHHLGPRTTLRGRYDFGYAWINYEPYVMSNLLTGAILQSWDEWGRTELAVQGGWYDFKYDRLFPPVGSFSTIDEDGYTVNAEAYHYWSPGLDVVGLEDLQLRGGYRYAHYEANGSEFDYDSHRFSFGFDTILPLEVRWDSYVSFTYQPYQETSVYADAPQVDAKRRERAWEFGTELERFVAENTSVLARYQFVDTGSNTEVYDYERHIVGAYVRVRFR